jgi:pimeloyl-ACP methyl ester carboxylesterase
VILHINGSKTYAYTGNHAVDTSLPTIIFIHGAANDHSVWSLQSRYFAYHGCNVLAVDLPGHGKSEGKAQSDITALAEWTKALMDTTGIRKAALVGHSMGSLVGLETAARYPETVSRLVMVGTAVPMPVSDALLKASAANQHVAYEMINAFAHSPRAQIGGNRLPGAWMTGNSMRLMERSADGVLHADFTACNDYSGGLDAAKKVQCPVLLILGQRDLMTPPRAAREAAGIFRHARTVLVDGTGHSLMSEQPDAILDALIDFLSTENASVSSWHPH